MGDDSDRTVEGMNRWQIHGDIARTSNYNVVTVPWTIFSLRRTLSLSFSLSFCIQSFYFPSHLLFSSNAFLLELNSFSWMSECLSLLRRARSSFSGVGIDIKARHTNGYL